MLNPLVAIITININPVLVHLGPLAIHWYGVMYVVAFYVAFRYGAAPHVAARGVSRAQIEKIAGWTIVWGLVGARFYYVIQNDFGFYITHPTHLLAVWEGGMAFFGAIGASALTLAFFAWREKLSCWLLLDGGVLFAAVGQPIGRIGNVINGDILGAQSQLPWATSYTYETALGHCAVLQPGFMCGVGYQPAALYEAIGTLILLGFLLALRRRGVRAGILGLTYLAGYAISQLIIFQWRASEPALLFGLKQAQWTALAVLFVVTPTLYIVWRRSNGHQEVAP